MRKLVCLAVLFFIVPFALFSQNLSNLEFISPFHDGVAAIKKGETWSFISEKGELLFDFRKDLVVADIKGKKYPVFNSNRCLISKKEEGITYFGYIDKKGKAVLNMLRLNAKKGLFDLYFFFITLLLHKANKTLKEQHLEVVS